MNFVTNIWDRKSRRLTATDEAAARSAFAIPTGIGLAWVMGFGLLLASSGCAAFGEDALPASPRRPTFAPGVGITQKGAVELEAGFLIDRHDFMDFPVLVKTGVSDQTEYFVGISPHRREATRNGYRGSFGDTIIGTRTKFVEQGDGIPDAAIQLETKLPTADEDRISSTEEIDFFASLDIEKAISDQLTLLSLIHI